MATKELFSGDAVLSQFERLNSDAFLYTPPKRDTLELVNSSHPTTIIFLAWTGASPKHFSKYIQKYVSLFPGARILLITINMLQFFSFSESSRRRDLNPALEVILQSSDYGTQKDRILVHGFSNGGIKRLWSLISLYRERTGKPFPVQVEVYDSCPGVAGRWQRDYYTLTRALPSNPFLRFLAKFLGATISTGLWILFHLTPFWQSFYKRPRREQNDPSFISANSSRLYIYSKEDKIVHWKDVESHAEERAKIGAAVKKVCVPGTEHCAHAKGDKWDGYWELIVSAWEKSNIAVP